jgi:tetratricopeptide (TPR) repeat protein
VTLGSVLRQTGRHRDALAVERRALRDAPTPAHRAHLLIGLAADAVGLGDLAAADRALRLVPRAGGWRAAVRLAWVRCERELLAGRPARAARHAARALALARRAGSARHEAKSLLFLGVARREAGLEGAREALEEAERLARLVGARPVAEVAASLGRDPPRR